MNRNVISSKPILGILYARIRRIFPMYSLKLRVRNLRTGYDQYTIFEGSCTSRKVLCRLLHVAQRLVNTTTAKDESQSSFA